MKILMATILTAGAIFAQKPEIHPNQLAPYVPSPYLIVDRMLELAKIKPGEKVYDLGSGDGRVVIAAAQKYDAKAVGIELSSRLVKSSQEEVKRLGLSDRVHLIHGDVFDADLSEADVVILYLLRDSNNTLKPKLEKSLKPGARVISHDYEIEGWKANQEEKVDAFRRGHKIYVYKMPPQK
ncbi:SAM-dependent methyltransferase [Bryobacter aggregatus]|uniref:SAM-dependent methyltransferase n=1 Tax=Bryobacter aggregatus TaxID=360054 RepID=UPI0012BAF119|nr:methyltransferase domain-containing protein [Bryobacter aggregatus]